MKPISRGEILALADYQRVRARLRPLFMVEKDRRRLPIGDHVTLLFENARTVWYQVHEMLRAEKIDDPAAVQQEIDTYNELVPGPGELSATMLIEYEDAAERDHALRSLIGIEQSLWLVAGQRRLPARFDERQMSPERVSSVQFVRFELAGISPQQLLELARTGALCFEINHPRLQVRALLPVEMARALADDLAEE